MTAVYVHRLSFALLALVAGPLAAQTPGDDAALCRTGRGPALQVDVSGLKDATGELWLELYPGEEADFLRDDTDLVKEGKTFRRIRVKPAAAGATSLCVRVPHAGRYALLVRHNRVGKDKFSFWSDGIGFPGNHAIGRSRPPFAEALVTAGGGVTATPVRMQYLHGLGGFSPR